MGYMAKNNILATIEDLPRRQAKYAPVKAALGELYGTPIWRRDTPAMDELVSCILSQNTSDINRDRGFDALRQRYPDWQAVLDAPLEELIDTIRPAGLSRQKAPRIQAILAYILAERGEFNIDFLNDMDLDEALNWLTALNGIGPKTAAIVMCFSFNRPAFPVDTHVHRVGQRIGFLPEGITADNAHPVMAALVPPEDHYAFHINLIQHGREICRARNPLCERCPVTTYCDYYQKIVKK